ncbi:hypothetical protein, partial [Pseudomonas sp. FSL R10-1339]|uniref:hypothetical protein n=1 Tax=Pseudomonas sp. FSL R10-1339 TaxID=2662196 RepID=UPI001C49C426
VSLLIRPSFSMKNTYRKLDLQQSIYEVLIFQPCPCYAMLALCSIADYILRNICRNGPQLSDP